MSWDEERARERREHFQAGLVMLAIGLCGMIGSAYLSKGDGLPLLFAGVAALGVITQRWFWMVASFVGLVTCAVTTLACIVHFQIFGAVLAIFGGIACFFILAWTVYRD